MTFDFPPGLTLLAALPVVFYMHLRRLWPRTVKVPSLVPWRVMRRTALRRRSRVPPTILLVMHLLAAGLLALAAAGPRLPGGRADATDRAIVLDVTTSMAAGTRWADAVAEADRLIATSRGEVTLVTLENAPRVIARNDSSGREARDGLRMLGPGATGARLDMALRLAAAVAGPGAELVVVTDGGVAPPSAAAPSARQVLVGEPLENLAVIRCAVAQTEAGPRLLARIGNLSRAARAVPVMLDVDNARVDERVVDVAPGATVDLLWDVPAGASTATVSIESDDELPLDDFATVLVAAEALEVQVAAATGSAVMRAVAALPDATIARVGLGNYRTDGGVDVSVFVGQVPKTLPPGGLLLFDPPADGLLTLRAEGESGVVTEVSDSPLVSGLDLTGVRLEGMSDPETPPWASAVLRVGGRTAIMVGTLADTRIVVFAFDPESGPLQQRIAFPLLVARSAHWAAGLWGARQLAPGATVRLPPGRFTVRGPDGTVHEAGVVFQSTRLPGLYEARARAGRRPRELRFAVNAGDAAESDLWGVLRWGPDTGAPGHLSDGPGRPLTPLLAGLALVTILVEGHWRGRRHAADRNPP